MQGFDLAIEVRLGVGDPFLESASPRDEGNVIAPTSTSPPRTTRDFSASSRWLVGTGRVVASVVCPRRSNQATPVP